MPGTFETDLASYEKWLGIYQRPGSVKLRLYYARRLSKWSPESSPWELSTQQLGYFVLSCGKSPSTRKNVADALRAMYRWGAMIGKVETNPADSLPRIAVPRAVPNPTPAGALRLALTEAPRSVDVVLILVATLSGLRRSELAQLHSRDIRNGVIRVEGKGGHERMVPLHPVLQEVLAGIDDGFLFPSEKNPTGHMLPGSIGQRLGDLLGPGWSGHTLRHLFATSAFATTLDILAVQQLLGHRNINTTMGYTLVPSLHLQEAVNGIELPVNVFELKQLQKAG
jgi:integrase/recombinase XerC